MKKIVFTGGGTAGHVTPNIALMELFDRSEWEIHYIGSLNGIEKDLIAKVPGVIYHGVHSGKLRRYRSSENVKDIFRVQKGYYEARRLLKKLKPDVVFSKGGYVSVPVVAAARRICPVVCHESDYTPGLANKIGAAYADKVCVTFEDTLKYIKNGKGVYTGTPVRPELFKGSREAGLRFAGFTGEKPVLLCVGGSQGAEAVNKALREALPALSGFDVIHLCGTGKLDESVRREGYVQYEYISDEMKDILAAADVVLSRSGANAVFEFLALHKPAVLVPLPLEASRGDQILNAKYFEKKGFAIHLDQHDVTTESLTNAILKLYEQREEYAARMAAEAGVSSAEKIYRLILDEIHA